MNERIEKLMVNASSGACYDGNEPVLSGTEIEKFAALIIKECLGDLKERIALRYQGSDKDRDIGYGMEIVYMDIVEKFRVE